MSSEYTDDIKRIILSSKILRIVVKYKYRAKFCIVLKKGAKMNNITSSMQKILFAILLVGALFFVGCGPSPEAIIRRKAYEDTVNMAKSIRYRCSNKEVWSALYSVIAQEFPITKESETRGYIETDWKLIPADEPKNVRVIAEILGDSLFRVIIRCPCRIKKVEIVRIGDSLRVHTSKDWSDVEDNRDWADKLYYRLYDRLKMYGVE